MHDCVSYGLKPTRVCRGGGSPSPDCGHGTGESLNDAPAEKVTPRLGALLGGTEAVML